jgi:hypothetical protein
LRREILRHLLIADGGEKAALFTIQGATGRRIAHALQHQMQQHTLELSRRLPDDRPADPARSRLRRSPAAAGSSTRRRVARSGSRS